MSTPTLAAAAGERAADVGSGRQVVLVHGDLGAVRFPAAVTEHGVDLQLLVVFPHVDATGSAHRHGRRIVLRVPAVGVVPVDERRNHSDPVRDHRLTPVGVQRGGPRAESRADAFHAPRWPVLAELRELGKVVAPPQPGEAGDQRRAGEVVEQQVERRTAGP
jgi:hypothetical protein